MLTALSSLPLPTSWDIWSPCLPKSGGRLQPARRVQPRRAPSALHVWPWPGPLLGGAHGAHPFLPRGPPPGRRPLAKCLAGSHRPRQGSPPPRHSPWAQSEPPAAGAAGSPDPDLPSWEWENQIWEVAGWEPRYACSEGEGAGPPGCAGAAEPRPPERKLPMKEEAGELPIRRLLAVDTGARVSLGRHGAPTKEPFGADPQAPSPSSFRLRAPKTLRREQPATRTPDSHAQGPEARGPEAWRPRYCGPPENGTVSLAGTRPAQPPQPGARWCSGGALPHGLAFSPGPGPLIPPDTQGRPAQVLSVPPEGSRVSRALPEAAPQPCWPCSSGLSLQRGLQPSPQSRLTDSSD